MNADENSVTLVSAKETENLKIKQYKNLRYRQNGLKQTKIMKILIVHNHVSKQKEKKAKLAVFFIHLICSKMSCSI